MENKLQNNLSIVIPIFNSAKTLKYLLESILIQDCTFLKEVIIVNDGSTDDLINTVNLYKNKKLILINKEHSNAGDTRNVGIEYASGGYVWFIDSDDVILKDAFITIENIIKEFSGVSIIEFSYSLYDEKLNKIRDPFLKDKNIFESKVIKEHICLSLKDYPVILTSIAYPWNKIYKNEFIKNNKLKFSSTTVHNDLFFKISAEVVASKIAFIHKPLYIHHINKTDGQLTQKKNYIRTESLIKALSETDEFISIHNKNVDIKLHYLIFKFNLISWAFSLVEKENQAYNLLYSFYIETVNKTKLSELFFIYSSPYTDKSCRDLIKKTFKLSNTIAKTRVVLFYIYKFFLNIKKYILLD